MILLPLAYFFVKTLVSGSLFQIGILLGIIGLSKWHLLTIIINTMIELAIFNIHNLINFSKRGTKCVDKSNKN